MGRFCIKAVPPSVRNFRAALHQTTCTSFFYSMGAISVQAASGWRPSIHGSRHSWTNSKPEYPEKFYETLGMGEVVRGWLQPSEHSHQRFVETGLFQSSSGHRDVSLAICWAENLSCSASLALSALTSM
mmetsp:Transcript_36211/g.144842  ORF Transcript_36211/g.144842 Transcript_36211/m.144842 type:complete len:129 (-) Transcript_36211:727-1113(-)